MLDVSCAVKNEAFGAPTHTRHSQNLSQKPSMFPTQRLNQRQKKKSPDLHQHVCYRAARCSADNCSGVI